MRLRKLAALFLPFALLEVAGAASAVEKLSLAPGETAGIYYLISSAIASIINK